MALQGPGQHERHPCKRRVALRHDRRRFAFEVDARRAEALQQAAIAIDREPLLNALRDRRPDTLDRDQLVDARRHDRVEVGERA